MRKKNVSVALAQGMAGNDWRIYYNSIHILDPYLIYSHNMHLTISKQQTSIKAVSLRIYTNIYNLAIAFQCEYQQQNKICFPAWEPQIIRHHIGIQTNAQKRKQILALICLYGEFVGKHITLSYKKLVNTWLAVYNHVDRQFKVTFIRNCKQIIFVTQTLLQFLFFRRSA
uniref:Uncharacterized protein n=1 Tax=Spironucleus salmonicida TaxID=348837 RepID=V6M0S2_9EUKA|eukprot:EST46724.1 Hypothetical protein SS50377_13238 [Spironucleus salmonicida]